MCIKVCYKLPRVNLPSHLNHANKPINVPATTKFEDIDAEEYDSYEEEELYELR